MAPLLLFVGAVVAGVGLTTWRLGRDTRRREGILAFAVRRGWTYEPTDPSLVGRWFGVPFGRGEDPIASAVVRGEVNGSPFTAFEYSYRVPRDADGGRWARLSATPTGTSVSLVDDRKRFSIVVVDLPAHLGAVTVVPESAVDRAGRAVGLDGADIELESEDFNRRYRVTARNPRNASDLLTPRTMEVLLSRPPFAFRVEGAHLVSWQPGLMDPMDVLRRASTLDAVADNVPSFLRRADDAGRPPRRLDSGRRGGQPRERPLPPEWS